MNTYPAAYPEKFIKAEKKSRWDFIYVLVPCILLVVLLVVFFSTKRSIGQGNIADLRIVESPELNVDLKIIPQRNVNLGHPEGILFQDLQAQLTLTDPQTKKRRIMPPVSIYSDALLFYEDARHLVLRIHEVGWKNSHGNIVIDKEKWRQGAIMEDLDKEFPLNQFDRALNFETMELMCADEFWAISIVQEWEEENTYDDEY